MTIHLSAGSPIEAPDASGTNRAALCGLLDAIAEKLKEHFESSAHSTPDLTPIDGGSGGTFWAPSVAARSLACDPDKMHTAYDFLAARFRNHVCHRGTGVHGESRRGLPTADEILKSLYAPKDGSPAEFARAVVSLKRCVNAHVASTFGGVA